MRLIVGTFAALGVALGAPAAAQSVGMQIVDTAGAPVGTVTAIQGENLQVKTDKHEVLVPKASFTVSGGKLLFAMTQAQLDAQVEAAAAASAKAVVAGATVKGTGGADVGKIEAVANDAVTITLASGKRIQLPAKAVRGNADGTVTIGYTSEQLEALVSGAGAADASGK
jgi:preprotein translocase subunit YajC